MLIEGSDATMKTIHRYSENCHSLPHDDLSFNPILDSAVKISCRARCQRTTLQRGQSLGRDFYVGQSAPRLMRQLLEPV